MGFLRLVRFASPDKTRCGFLALHVVEVSLVGGPKIVRCITVSQMTGTFRKVTDRVGHRQGFLLASPFGSIPYSQRL